MTPDACAPCHAAGLCQNLTACPDYGPAYLRRLLAQMEREPLFARTPAGRFINERKAASPTRAA